MEWVRQRQMNVPYYSTLDGDFQYLAIQPQSISPVINLEIESRVCKYGWSHRQFSRIHHVQERREWQLYTSCEHSSLSRTTRTGACSPTLRRKKRVLNVLLLGIRRRAHLTPQPSETGRTIVNKTSIIECDSLYWTA